MLASTVQLAAIALVLAPSLASAAIFPKDSLVKMLDPKDFRKVMKANQTSMVAFVAPWCGHCQRMVPEYSKAAKGLHPLLPVYAVDCDVAENKRLCSDEGVKGFPTVKVYPRGNQLGSMTYESGERTASALFNWASRRIPNKIAKLSKVEEIPPWAKKESTTHRALLLTKEKKVPLMWKSLGNKYKDQLVLGAHSDVKGKSSVALGLEAGGAKEAKVLIYPAGSTKFVKYEGRYNIELFELPTYPYLLPTGSNKFDALSKFFDSVLDGTADFSALDEKVVPEEKETVREDGAETETPEAPQVIVDDGAEQVILEQPKDEVVKPAPTGAQCERAEDGPGAEAPVECDPPATQERPVDEL
ncbi:hypothetical protein C0991_000577 [Blastosporella zonata]|nr:hypothetical protein C0991_000577 [Blastosporella zonata]